MGTQTLLQDLYVAPWMARPNETDTAWAFHELPQHGTSTQEPSVIAQGLIARLRDELRKAANGKENILLPLSGGMDSRVVAAVLLDLQVSGMLSAKVTAVTWGMPDSRDVVYAQRLAQQIGWNWIHIPITSETLMRNISLAADLGCATSALHLHAMPEVRSLEGYDLLIAASYGDSVGRAVYSGRHVLKLRTLDKLTNRYGLLRDEVFKKFVNKSLEEIYIVNRRFPRIARWQRYEVQQQANYWARHLNPCFAYINAKLPVYQAYGSPSVFGFMWNLSPTCRTDDVYWHCLNILAPRLLSVPWAKTGKRYLVEEAQDGLRKDHSAYHLWAKTDLYQFIHDLVFSGNVFQIGLFNKGSAEKIGNTIRKGQTNNPGTLVALEIFLWLGSFSLFLDRYSVESRYEYPRKRDNMGSRLRAAFDIEYSYCRPYIGPTAFKKLLRRALPERSN